MMNSRFEQPEDGGEENPIKSGANELTEKLKQEIATRDAILEEVSRYLKGDDKLTLTVEQMQTRIAMYDERATQNKTTAEKIWQQLPTNEQVAFKLALAKELEDLYYHHYVAAFYRTKSERN
ncbi:MAG: hypothetical protein NUV54_00570 [Candidatus Taylorbacteria bacterium]|nr:hypothetical protein [Candidatus Taylorbacteria bacterium]